MDRLFPCGMTFHCVGLAVFVLNFKKASRNNLVYSFGHHAHAFFVLVQAFGGEVSLHV